MRLHRMRAAAALLAFASSILGCGAPAPPRPALGIDDAKRAATDRGLPVLVDFGSPT